MNQDDLDDQAREELEYALVGVGESLGFDSRAFATSTSTTAQYEAPGAGYHIFHLSPVGSDTVEQEHLVVRHLECGHTNAFEALHGEAQALAADARKLIGTKDYCSQCAAKEE